MTTIETLATHLRRQVLPAALCTALTWNSCAQAQQVQDLDLKGVPPDLISPNAPPSGSLSAPPAASGAGTLPSLTVQPVVQQSVARQSDQIAQTQIGPAGNRSAAGNTLAKPAPVDLGQTPDRNGAAGATANGMPADAVDGANPAIAAGLAERAAQAAAKPKLRRAVRNDSTGPAERVLFDRAPVRVPLPVGRERMLTLPAAAALHVPDDMDKVARIQNIERTLYITALVPFAPIRVIAELVDTGQQIPLDLVADKGTAASTGELQVSVIDPRGAADGIAGSPASPVAARLSGTQTQGLDMVQLTRYAAQQLYAPARLAGRLPGVAQIEVARVPQPALIRGVAADIVPLGAWRSGPLYVTALRLTNRSRYPLEIPLEQLRGSWIAATAQHGRVGPAGSDTDTTAIYLISERPFEACL